MLRPAAALLARRSDRETNGGIAWLDLNPNIHIPGVTGVAVVGDGIASDHQEPNSMLAQQLHEVFEGKQAGYRSWNNGNIHHPLYLQ